ncbi:hypothetical protein EUS_17710 [[Eubacterium] siraeum 70/3]|jgi:hypothetical protein|uniref:Uncharacterized protein n=1 Tax=[Eubacterium] siraeum 70/3 TaxID=657319 RepID=D4JUT1_9FIRM|nr:hypothetical protein EUS_17710 [[Eubacterium] siraeum 70/3]
MIINRRLQAYSTKFLKQNSQKTVSKKQTAQQCGFRLSINPRTAKMQKSKSAQTKNLINKKNFTQL